MSAPAIVLAQMGRDTGGVLLFEELAGLVEVRVARDDHGAVTGATIAAPQPLSLGLELPVEAVAACAGLQPATSSPRRTGRSRPRSAIPSPSPR